MCGAHFKEGKPIHATTISRILRTISSGPTRNTLATKLARLLLICTHPTKNPQSLSCHSILSTLCTIEGALGWDKNIFLKPCVLPHIVTTCSMNWICGQSKIEFAYTEIEFQKPTLRNLLCGDNYPQSPIFFSELWLLSAQLASLLNSVHCFPMPILHFIQPWGLLCISISVPPLPVLGNLSNVQLHTAAALKTDSTVNDSSSQNSTSVSFTQWISFSGLSCK